MFKKLSIIGGICIVASIAVFAISLPLAMKNGIGKYNKLLASGENFMEEIVIGESVNEVQLFADGNTDRYNNFVLVGQSPDEKIRIQTTDRGFWRYEVKPSVENNKAIVSIRVVHSPAITEQNFQKLIAGSVYTNDSIYLQLPKSVSITSQKSDGMFFKVPSVVSFPNAEQIRSHGYYVTEEDSWKIKYQEIQNELLQSQNDLQQLENELNMYIEQGNTDSVQVDSELIDADPFQVE